MALKTLNDSLLMFHVRLVRFLQEDDAQDLIEYALVVALIAFGATAAMRTLANKISTSFSTIGTTLTTSV